MNRHAKASSAGSVPGSADVRNPLALLSLVSAFALILTLALSGQASASQVYKFKEAFGSGAHPTFEESTGLAVDQSSGDLLVMDRGNGSGKIRRFKADGTPDNFSTLGTNVIDGAGGDDKTPEEGLTFPSAPEAQIAIDNSGTITDGDIYVTTAPNVIDIFASSGAYLGQLTETPSGHFSEACGVAVDSGGDVYVGDYTEGIKKFSPTANPPVNADFVTTFSEPNTPCTLAAGAGPTAGSLFSATYSGSLFKQDPATGHIDYAASGVSTTTETVAPSSGNVFVASGQEVRGLDASGSSSAAVVAKLVAQSSVKGVAVDLAGNIYISRSGSSEIEVFGNPVSLPTVTATAATNVTGTKATLNGSVNPEGVAVTECTFEYGPTQAYGQTASCEGLLPTDSAYHPVSAKVTGLNSDGATVHYRLVATNANGSEVSDDRTLITADTVSVEPASSVGVSAATLHGTVHPEGLQYTGCKFEYGLTTSAGFEKEASCNPPAADITPDSAAHGVSAAVTGLQPGATYKFRLTVTNANGTLTTEEETFSTSGPPVLSEVRALNASQSAATIEGKIDPNGFATSYRFEWGPTTSYGNQVPAELEPFIGEGSKPIRVSAKLTGLSAGQAYHYRIVASSSAGTTTTPDEMFETLNSCGLPDGRCFELVSRREAGPVAIPGEHVAPAEMHFQAATGGPGALAYVVEAGYPNSTKAAEVLYRGNRGSGGWSSIQLSNPIVALNEQGGVESGSGNTKLLSNDLSCGFLESPQPLTDDPSTRLAIEDGGTNLYRINPDNSDNPYTAVSNLAPENSQGIFGRNNFDVAGASQDCGKVVFNSTYHYPGVPGVSDSGGSRLLEWDEGTLRNVGIVPGPSGKVAVAAAGGSSGDHFNSVSEDGSRVFFSAERQTSPNSEEIGKQAVFVREDDGAIVRDISLSQAATPDEGATYVWATPDGSHVFFTANAGLTEESSAEGTDLYEYNLETEELIDRTAVHTEGGARVSGFVGASDDGSNVYFASRNQLVPGRGSTLSQNLGADTYSIYGESSEGVSFVGTVRSKDLPAVVLPSDPLEWSARVSPDGRYLLFESSADNTGYHGDGSLEAYLYDAKESAEGLTCISCRQDGQPSLAPERYKPLDARIPNSPLHPSSFLVMHEGEPRVFFSSPNLLAPGAVENQNNVYEWAHGQIFRLTSALEDQLQIPISGYYANFAGASGDGSDVYFVTPETLNWEDGDERLSLYDARVGGGFPEPPAPPAPCEATTEGSCQGPAQGAPAVGGAASAAFNGPGNPPEQSTKKSKKKPHKKKQKHAKKKGKKQARQANGNRRAGK